MRHDGKKGPAIRGGGKAVRLRTHEKRKDFTDLHGIRQGAEHYEKRRKERGYDRRSRETSQPEMKMR